MSSVLMFPRLMVLAAAWWYQCATSISCSFGYWCFLIGQKISPRPDNFYEKFFEEVMRFLLAAEWAWLIAGDYLREKWEVERLEANRRYDLENPEWRDKL